MNGNWCWLVVQAGLNGACACDLQPRDKIGNNIGLTRDVLGAETYIIYKTSMQQSIVKAKT